MLDTFGQLEVDYIATGKVRYIAHPFHLGSPEMALATEAAWCAQDQGDYFGYQHALFENQGRMTFNQITLADLAAKIGFDRSAFSDCLSSRTHQGRC